MNTVFYAWQSDVSENVNHYLIRSALKQAIKMLEEKHAISVEYDEATRDAVGAVHIAEEIFKKIDSCVAFIADVTIVAKYGNAPVKYVPNSNVLVELGYAAKVLDWRCISLVFNNAFSKVDGIPIEYKTALPFDYGFRRVLHYDLPETASRKECEAKANEMARDMCEDLKSKIIEVRKRPKEIDHTKIPYVTLISKISRITSYTPPSLVFAIIIDREQIADVLFGTIEGGEDILAAPKQPLIRSNDRKHFIWKSVTTIEGGFEKLKAQPEKVFIEFRAADAKRYRVEYEMNITDMKQDASEILAERRFFVRQGANWFPVND